MAPFLSNLCELFEETRVQRQEARPKALYQRNKPPKTITICQQLD
jgi:hypothetical protein